MARHTTDASFQRAIDRLEEKVMQNISQGVSDAVTSSADEMVDEIPVDTGLTKGSTFAKVDQDTSSHGSPDPSGSGVKASMASTISAFDIRKNSTISVGNSNEPVFSILNDGSPNHRAYNFVGKLAARVTSRLRGR